MLDEPLDQPAPSESAAEPVDACGCVPLPAGQTTAAVEPERPESARPENNRPAMESAASTPAAAIETPRRALKIVLSLQPATGSERPGYRALLAVGAEGCDPLLRSVDVAGLPAALGELPALVAAAEARWQTQPRYPAARREAKAAAPPSRAGKSGGPAPPTAVTRQDETAKPDNSTAAQPSRSGPKPAPRPTPADQLSLFG